MDSDSMKTRLLMLFVLIMFVIPLQSFGEEIENPLSNSGLQRYIDECDPLLHKDSLPDIAIETDTEWYDLQYCMWRPHYPDVSGIDNCVDLFDTLYAFHNAPKPDCGIQRYNKDGTPRGICEPEPYLSGMYRDENLINSDCTENYSEWAYKTDANDIVFYVFEEMEKYQNWQLKQVLDRCEENNPNRSIKSFKNYTHYIDSESCKWNLKEISKKIQAVPLCVDENTILKDGVCQKIDDSEYLLALDAYEKLNNRTRTDSEFEQLMQTEIVGFGVDDPNKGIFITVDPKFATKENFAKYENMFRETVGDDIPVRFEINERGSFPEGKDPDYILLVLIPVLALIGAIFYLWRKRK